MSPTQRSLGWLRKRGFKVGVVERWTGTIRRDLFNIIDIIAIKDDLTLGVQSTGTAFAEHAAKMTVEHREACEDWLRGPGRHLMLIGWRRVASYRKDGSRGVRDVYKPRIAEITLEKGTVSIRLLKELSEAA